MKTENAEYSPGPGVSDAALSSWNLFVFDRKFAGFDFPRSEPEVSYAVGAGGRSR